MSVHLAKGTRDLLPDQMRKRLAVIDTVRGVFERFGFEPLDTPAFERIETLSGKYGDEGEKLIFRILKRGEGGERGEVDQALRYDLTVPLARVLAMHPELRLPFKRYQMAPVWRADRPQRGRFREFWQCDVDIAGSTSPLADAECVAVADAALSALGFREYVVRLNDRRILRAMARAVGASHCETGLLVAVDKLDKIGRDGVSRELGGLGLGEEAVASLWQILDVPRGHHETLDALAPLLDEEGKRGVDTLREVLTLALAQGVPPERLQVDPTLARGLDYYTGPVFEVEVLQGNIGSVSGGGRYDELVGMFSGSSIPCVGVSLGLDRLITVMDELGMLDGATTTAEVLVTIHDDELRSYALQTAAALRREGVRTELYLDDRKLKHQLKYAHARGFRWVVFAGPDERDAGLFTLKDLISGEQHKVAAFEAARILRAE
jgi:histidyl-tRNA synthetase